VWALTRVLQAEQSKKIGKNLVLTYFDLKKFAQNFEVFNFLK
jgi:hypothetical protein